jgi:hypothetical protein
LILPFSTTETSPIGMALAVTVFVKRTVADARKAVATFIIKD